MELTRSAKLAPPQVAQVEEMILRKFEQLQPDERSALLIELNEKWCPECGQSHDQCKCEMPGDEDVDE
jgi:hypothetical protein